MRIDRNQFTQIMKGIEAMKTQTFQGLTNSSHVYENKRNGWVRPCDVFSVRPQRKANQCKA